MNVQRYETALWTGIQRLLRKTGSNLVVDGLPGPRTYSALQQFQTEVRNVPFDTVLEAVRSLPDPDKPKVWNGGLLARTMLIDRESLYDPIDSEYDPIDVERFKLLERNN